MLSLHIHQHGGPAALLLDEVPRPALSNSNGVLVAMKAAALNHLDLWIRNGLAGVSLPPPAAIWKKAGIMGRWW
ncbi:MAG: hypothetical protein GH143_09945 [Calditrichaeota bacterium]|nr:hypothetical protein [Calditrichota bacterium]